MEHGRAKAPCLKDCFYLRSIRRDLVTKPHSVTRAPRKCGLQQTGHLAGYSTAKEWEDRGQVEQTKPVHPSSCLFPFRFKSLNNLDLPLLTQKNILGTQIGVLFGILLVAK